MAEETLVVLDFAAIILQCCGKAFVSRTISRARSIFGMLVQDCVCFDSPVTIARRGDGMIGKGNMLDVAKSTSVGDAGDCMANGSPTVAPCTFIHSS